MSVNGATSYTFMDYARRAGRLYLHSNFGTGMDEFMDSLNGSIFGKCPKRAHWYSNPYKGSDWSNFGTKFKDAIKAVEKHEAGIRAANGGSYFKAFWHQLSTIPDVFKTEWNTATKAAKAAGKSVGWARFGAVNKAFMKRMPLIGGLMAVAFQLPNICAAFKNGGLGTGICEVGKAAAKIGVDTAGFMVGQALIPIPIVGGLIGCMAAGWLGEKILGKGYKEKLEEQNGGNPTPGWVPYLADNSGGGGGQQMPIPQWTPIRGTMTDEQIAQAGMMLRNWS